MSNSNVLLIKSTFKKYDITEVIAKRAINSKNPESKTTELIIKNYTFKKMPN